MKRLSFSLFFLLVILLLSGSIALARPLDLNQHHWAASYINQLLDREVMYVYDDYNFKPEQPITRGEFAYSLAQVLKLNESGNTNLTDINNYFAYNEILSLINAGIINGYPDNTFRPFSQITRAEIITMLARSLELEDDKNRINITTNNFSDVDNSHWANDLISLASALEMINGYPDGSFKPNHSITRAEAAKLLMNLSDLSRVEGKVIASYPSSNVITLQFEGQEKNFLLSNDALIGRNSRMIGLDELLTADDAYLIMDRDGRGIYLKAYGLINQADITENLSSMTNNLLKPDDLLAIVEGDFASVGNNLKDELITNLLAQGVSEAELAALLAGNWDQLQSLSQERVIKVVAETTSIPQEIIWAALDRDWEKAEEISKTNAIRLGVQELLRSGLLSG